jgi:hypothetical protein
MGKIRRTVKKSRTARKNRTARKRQNGGVIFMGAPVSYSIPFGQRQPTEAIMERATTAGGGAVNEQIEIKRRAALSCEERMKEDINRFNENKANIVVRFY